MALAGTKTSGTALSSGRRSLTRGEVSFKVRDILADSQAIWLAGTVTDGGADSVYAPVLKLLVWQWYNDADYSHGFLVPVLSAYLIWARRDKLRQIPRVPVGLGNGRSYCSRSRLLFSAAWALSCPWRGFRSLDAICGLIVYFAGSKVLRAMAFPIAFLLFAIPMPVVIYNEIVFPLQFIASKFATRTLEMLNLFPIMREGNVLILPRHAAGSGRSVQRYPFADVAAGAGCRLWLCG